MATGYTTFKSNGTKLAEDKVELFLAKHDRAINITCAVVEFCTAATVSAAINQNIVKKNRRQVATVAVGSYVIGAMVGAQASIYTRRYITRLVAAGYHANELSKEK